MSEWEAEIEVDEPLARALITAQFPELDAAVLERIGEGWDYTIWATSEALVFRFPRRSSVIAGMEREMAVLPSLSAQLSTAIPDAGYQGVGGATFAWPFFGSQLIAGRELTRAGLAAGDRGDLARELGGFLRELHALAPPEALAAVIDPMRRADMGFRAARTREMIARISGLWPAADRAEPILAAAERLTPQARRVLSHGDLHLRQILVTDAGHLSGVVDWVDICLAPASVDLCVYWSLFAPPERAQFLSAYGDVTPEDLLGARVLALCLSAMLAAYASARGDERLLSETLAELDRALVD